MGYGLAGDAQNDIHEVVLGLLQLTNQNSSGKCSNKNIMTYHTLYDSTY